VIPAQQQQPVQQLNLNDLPEQINQVQLDLNLDPLEVVINPANPPDNFIEINEFVEEIE
jgi:hypothetical protein